MTTITPSNADCCTYTCNQSRHCPVRAQPAAAARDPDEWHTTPGQLSRSREEFNALTSFCMRENQRQNTTLSARLTPGTTPAPGPTPASAAAGRQSSLTRDPDAWTNRPQPTPQNRTDARIESVISGITIILLIIGVGGVLWSLPNTTSAQIWDAIYTWGGTFPATRCP